MNRIGSSKEFAPASSILPGDHIDLDGLISSFPSTRYYGSKRKLLRWILDAVLPIEHQTVLDAFGGTASVSLLFQSMGKKVTYHDAFAFNGYVAETMLAAEPAISREELDEILSEVKPLNGVVYRNFSGIFFTDDENAWIDGFIQQALNYIAEGPVYALLHYLLYQASLKKRPFNLFHRANLSLRTSSGVSRRFGNLSTWNRSFEDHIRSTYEEYALSRACIRKWCPEPPPAKILEPGDIGDVSGDFDLVYLDPPYLHNTPRYRWDHYWLRYHFLEGLARYGAWEENIIRSSPTRQMKAPEHFTAWSKNGEFQQRLYSLIARHRRSTVVLSYVREGCPTPDEIEKWFSSLFDSYEILSIQHSHALSKTKKTELLFIGKGDK